MKISSRLFLLFFAAFIFSCSKDSLVDLGYPSTYHKTGIRPNGDLRVFSSAGEINNRDIISRFNQTDSFFFNNTSDELGNYSHKMDSIYFSDAGNAIMTEYNTALHCLVKQEGKNFLLTRTDTTNGTTYLNEMSHNITYYLGQVKPDLYSESLYSSTRGNYYFNYSATEKFILSKPGAELVAPILEYKIYRAAVNGGGDYSGYINNILQDDFFKNLDKGDTVIIKDYLITYEK
jgi:hypothetical protein